MFHFSKTTLSQLHIRSNTVYKNTVINIIIIIIIIIITACSINFSAPGKTIPVFFGTR